MLRRALVVSALCTIAVAETRAHADDEAPKSVTHEYSPYEKETIENALKSEGREIDPAPEGKTIEGYDVVTLDVFEPRDPVPRFLNVFHWTSRPDVIARELLLHPGDAYQKVLIDETARNLRKLDAQLSLVLVLPVKGSKPNTVRVLLVTKDVWSLRLNSDFRLVNGHLEYLYLQPSEQNVFGTHHIAAAQFYLQPLSYSLGASYRIPWVLGQRVSATATANLIVSRETRKVEGSNGELVVARPLYSARTPWAAEARYRWYHDVYRRYAGAELAGYDPESKKVPALSADPNAIPWLYRRTYDFARIAATRSFGWAHKHDVSFGAEVLRARYDAYDLAPFRQDFAAKFVSTVVPVSNTRVGPFVQYRTYRTDYLRTLDVDILGLQEDFRLGHDLLAKVYPALKVVGSTRDFLGLDARAAYTAALGDGFVRGVAKTVVEAGVDHLDHAQLELGLHVVTPRTSAGRLVYDADWLARMRNFYNDLSSAGSEARPRGYPTRFLFGSNLVAQSIEWRTRPLEILKTQWGLVGFWDSGSAYESLSDLTIYHSVGAGIRALFPQLDRVAIRLDVGVPIGRNVPAGVPPYAVIVTVDQAFPVPNVIDNTRASE